MYRCRRWGWSCRGAVSPCDLGSDGTCTCCSCPLTRGWRRPRAAWQPLDGGISPEFRFSLFLSTSQGSNLISEISYGILIYAKFTVSFSNIQSRKKLIKLKLHSLSNSYFKRKICIFMAKLLMHHSFSVLHLWCSGLIWAIFIHTPHSEYGYKFLYVLLKTYFFWLLESHVIFYP